MMTLATQPHALLTPVTQVRGHTISDPYAYSIMVALFPHVNINSGLQQSREAFQYSQARFEASQASTF